MTEHALILCREPGRHSTLDKGHEEGEIYTYKKNNILYQADEVSNCKGQVSLQLNDGRVVTGRSEGIGGVYDCEGYKMLTALTLEVDEYDYEFIEEEQVKKILG